MTIPMLKSFLLWSGIINAGVLLFYFVVIVSARGFIFKIHSKMFKITEEQFNAIHYCGVLIYKTVVFVFFFCPYFALCLI